MLPTDATSWAQRVHPLATFRVDSIARIGLVLVAVLAPSGFVPSMASAQIMCAGRREYGPWRLDKSPGGVDVYLAFSRLRCVTDVQSAQIRFENSNPYRVKVVYQVNFASKKGHYNLTRVASTVLSANWRGTIPAAVWEPFQSEYGVKTKEAIEIDQALSTSVGVLVCRLEEAVPTTNPASGTYGDPCQAQARQAMQPNPPVPEKLAPLPQLAAPSVRPAAPKSTASIIPSVLEGDAEALKALLDLGANPNAKDPEYGMPAVMIAARKGRSDMIEMLIKAKVDVNARARDGYTALMSAANSGVIVSAELLLKAGADVNARQDRGITALGVIHDLGPRVADMIALLVRHGATR